MKKVLLFAMKRLIAIALLLFPLLAHAEDVEIDGLWYRLNAEDMTAQVICSQGGQPYSGDVVIPEKVSYEDAEYSVTSIGNSAFQSCITLSSIVIPDGVNRIGKAAFMYCDALAFVDIPNSVTIIDESAFDRCLSLHSIVIPEGVTTIGKDAFAACMSLESINIPSSVKTIGTAAFHECRSLTSVHITDLAAWCNISCDHNPLLYAHHLFLNGKEIEDLVIPENVTSIGNDMFRSCTGLTSVTIGNNVTTIGKMTFRDCTNLTTINLGNCLTYISDGAFQGCSSLTSIVIPNSVKTIWSGAFGSCNLLSTVIIGSGIETIGPHAFGKCKKIKEVYCYTESVPSADSFAFMETPIKYRTLYVPATLVEEYKKVAPWNEFKQILPMSDEELGIDGKEYQDETTVSYYRPDGKQLQSPQRGLNIVRHADGTAKTVVVK